MSKNKKGGGKKAVAAEEDDWDAILQAEIEKNAAAAPVVVPKVEPVAPEKPPPAEDEDGDEDQDGEGTAGDNAKKVNEWCA